MPGIDNRQRNTILWHACQNFTYTSPGGINATPIHLQTLVLDTDRQNDLNNDKAIEFCLVLFFLS